MQTKSKKRKPSTRSGSQTRVVVKRNIDAPSEFWDALAVAVEASGMSRNAYVQAACVEYMRARIEI
jgi:hypothetical protein